MRGGTVCICFYFVPHRIYASRPLVNMSMLARQTVRTARTALRQQQAPLLRRNLHVENTHETVSFFFRSTHSLGIMLRPIFACSTFASFKLLFERWMA